MIALHRQSIRSTIRTVTLLAALTSLLLTMITPFVGTAAAAHADPYNAADGSLDAASFDTVPDACGGNADTQAVGGTKLDTIHTDDPPVIDLGSVTPKDNLCDFWLDSTIDAHGNVWLYAAFTRESTEGTAHVALELLNSAADCDISNLAACNPWENRSDGTRIIGFTWQGNDGIIAPTLWTWSGSAFDPGQALGSSFTGSTGQGGAFGEMAVDLTAAGILPNVNDPTAACQLISAVIPLTLPGLSLGSQPKDVVLGEVDPIATCGSLRIEKVVAGGDDFGQTFVGEAVGATTLTTAPALGHGDGQTFTDVKAGSFAVSEKIGGTTLAIGDTVAGWTLTNIDCGDGSATDPDATAEVVVGETTTCVLHNSPDLPTITLEKTVVNDDGGTAVEDDFQASIDTVGDVDWDVTTEVAPGTHTASETTLPGYAASDWGGDCDTDGTVSLSLGDDVTCTITNDDVAPTVVLRKTVVNDDGGTLGQGDFPSSLDGDALAWDTTVEILAGNHTASETQQTGYSSEGWGGDCATDGTFAAVVGGTYECTITNDDAPAGLTIVKQVINDDGGTLQATDFPLTYTPDGGSPVTVTNNVAVSVPAGTYTIGETQQPGYELTGIACDNGVSTEPGEDTIEVTVPNGDSVVCTITNDDIAPTITLVKTVVNDDGGTLTADDFQGYVDGGEVAWEVPVDVMAGTHTASEDAEPGYTAGDWGGDCATDGSLTTVLDTDYTCTITNDDIAPTVVLRKTVVNDDGGTLSQDDFPVTLDGDTVAWDQTITTAAGTHTASETTQPGYLPGAWGGDCAADGSLTAELAGSYECTITNDDISAGLTVVKQVVNDDGGTAVVGDFPLTVTPEGGDATVVTSGAQTFVDAGTYTISEEQQPGYALESISCDNGVTTTEDTVDVTVGLDEVVVCTVVNDDLPIGIQVIKVPDVEEVDFAAGGEDEVITYTYTVTNTGETPLTDLSLVDDVLGTIELPVDQLAVGQTVFGTAEHVVTQADVDAGEVVNVAVVEGTSPDGRTTDDDDDAEVAVNPVQVLPNVVVEPAPTLPATGADTMRWALFAALVAGLGALILLATGEVQTVRRRRD